MRGTGRAVVALLVAGTIGLVAALAPTAGLAAGGGAPVTVPIVESPAWFDFGFSPKRLPRSEPGAAKLRFAFELAGSTLAVRPGISSATIGLDKSIILDPRGLPTCPYGIQIDAAGPIDCSPARVGRSEATLEIALPEQPPVEIHAVGGVYKIGGHRGLGRLVAKLPFGPPLSSELGLILQLSRVREGRIGTEATIKIPELIGGNGQLVDLNLELSRTFKRNGEPVSFVTAECRDGKLTATMSAVLSDGTKASEESTRACSIRRAAVEP